MRPENQGFGKLAAKRRAADDDWGYTTHSGTGHYVHFHGLIEFIRVSELGRKLVNVIWSTYFYYGVNSFNCMFLFCCELF